METIVQKLDGIIAQNNVIMRGQSEARDERAYHTMMLTDLRHKVNGNPDREDDTGLMGMMTDICNIVKGPKDMPEAGLLSRTRGLEKRVKYILYILSFGTIGGGGAAAVVKGGAVAASTTLLGH